MNPSHISDHWIYVGPLNMVVLLHHVVKSEDAENDADLTVGELIGSFEGTFMGKLPKQVLESALYCANMEFERGQYWHPLGKNFHIFVQDLLQPQGYEFDFYYNTINERKKK